MSAQNEHNGTAVDTKESSARPTSTGTTDHQSTNIENGHNTDDRAYVTALSSIELSIQSAEHETRPVEPDSTKNWKLRHARVYNNTKIGLLNAIVFAYFAWATYHYVDSSKLYLEIEWPPQNTTGTVGYCPTYCGIQWCDGYGMLVILLTLVYAGLIYYHIVKPIWGERIQAAVLKPIQRTAVSLFRHRWSKLIACGVVVLAVLAYIILDSLSSPDRLQSLCGIVAMIGLGYVFSAHRTRINYRPVMCGLLFQFLLGVLCIRWDVGRNIFQCIGKKVATFLAYTNTGSLFVYGSQLIDARVFAFAILPIIFFFSFIISILYYLGAMQFVVQKLGWILQTIIGTTVCESVTCAANIFLGMSESPLLIRPYIRHLTASELHVIMASGYATVSGSVLAAYISYGAEPAHLITSSVMAAPAALGFAKLFYPETEESKTKSGNMVMEKSTDSSVLDAASNGANLAINIVLGITANIVAFMAFVAFLNGLVEYLGVLVGYDGISFEWFLSKLFIPLAWLIGIPWADCEKVAYVIASKMIINEFVAYERLGIMKRAAEISLRSSAIATYAICGFANPSSLGIMIASLSSMAPERRHVITAVAIRGFVAGSMICFLTASIAGVLMTDDIFLDFHSDVKDAIV